MSLKALQEQRTPDGLAMYSNWVIGERVATAINSNGDLVIFTKTEEGWV